MDLEKITSKEAAGNFFKYHWRGFLAFWIPIIALPIMMFDSDKKFRCAWLVVVIALYWIFEILPLFATSTLPVVMLPLLGILDTEAVCKVYLSDALIMFLFGLIVAIAIEYSNLHTRIALGTILLVGIKPRRLHAGLYLVTFCISMWLSNSASTAMMCPVIKAILEELAAQGMFNLYMENKEGDKVDELNPSYIAMSYYFAVAYAATIGGCATLIGTGTNLTFKSLYDTRFPDAKDKIDFTSFMAYAFPMSILHAILVCVYLQIFYLGLFRRNQIARDVKKAGEGEENIKKVLKQKYDELGPISSHEIQVIIVFILMLVLLFTMKPGFAPGWGEFFPEGYIKSAFPAVLCAGLLFVLPIHYGCCRFCIAKPPYPENATPSLLSWKFTNTHTPWALCFLLGGGNALAAGSIESGMAQWLGEKLKGLGLMPPAVILMVIILLSIALTNFSSNVAICNIVVPVVAELTVAIKVHPLFLILPSGMATNMAFHLPVGTPPNAIVAGYAQIKTKYIALAGIGPSIFALICLLIVAIFWAKVVYPSVDTFPDWAEQ